MKNIAVIGDVMLDKYVFVECSGKSAEAPILCWREIDKPQYLLGGAGNVASHLVGPDVNVLLFGVVGNDHNGGIVESLCRASNIGGFLARDDKRPTTTKCRIMHDTTQLIRIDRESRIPISDDLVEIMTLLFDDIKLDGLVIADHAKGMLTPSLCAKISTKVEDIPIVLDPHPDGYSDWYHLSCVTPNVDEAELIVGRDSIESMASALYHVYDTNSVLITMGKSGAYYFDNQYEEKIPAPKVNAVDVCGAGDVLVSQLLIGIVDGLSIPDAAKIAVDAASRSIETCRVVY